MCLYAIGNLFPMSHPGIAREGEAGDMVSGILCAGLVPVRNFIRSVYP